MAITDVSIAIKAFGTVSEQLTQLASAAGNLQLKWAQFTDGCDGGGRVEDRRFNLNGERHLLHTGIRRFIAAERIERGDYVVVREHGAVHKARVSTADGRKFASGISLQNASAHDGLEVNGFGDICEVTDGHPRTLPMQIVDEAPAIQDGPQHGSPPPPPVAIVGRRSRTRLVDL